MAEEPTSQPADLNEENSSDIPVETQEVKERYVRKDGMPYRPLSIPERDFLFALYDKHGSNMMHMTRDQDCIFKSHRQLSYYCRFYGFQTKLAERRQVRAEEVLAELKDAKTTIIERAMEMMRPRMIPLLLTEKNGVKVYAKDAEGNIVFVQVYPSDREIKTAWEIIKVEMGEATTVSKTDHTTKGMPLPASNEIIFADFSGDAPSAPQDENDS